MFNCLLAKISHACCFIKPQKSKYYFIMPCQFRSAPLYIAVQISLILHQIYDTFFCPAELGHIQ